MKRAVSVSEPEFFGFHPLKLRLTLLVGFVAAGTLTVWAAVAFFSSQLPRDILRAGLSGGLAAAMALSVFRLRPRAGWGVKLTPLSVLISKPRGGLIELPWSAVKSVSRIGEKRDTLAFWLEERERILVPAHLFSRAAHFEALVAAVDARFVAPRTSGAGTLH